MHPYTVYGIETLPRSSNLVMRAYSLHAPLYRLRYWNRLNLRRCWHRLTVTIACTLIPFTVLKLPASLFMRILLSYCMHPYTVYGIETLTIAAIFLISKLHAPLYRLRYWNIEKRKALNIFTSILHAPLYRLRYWNNIASRTIRAFLLLIACTLIPFTVLKLR